MAGFRVIYDISMRFVVIAILLACTLVHAGQAPQPKAVCKYPVADIGVVEQGRTVEVNFVIQNLGNAPLEIRGITTSCGCTAASATGNIVPPGKSTQVRVRYDTKGKMGHTEKTVTVAVNDPQVKLMVLTLRGAVVVPQPDVPVDRAIFSQTCANCHMKPAIGRKGPDLYGAVCSMCHENPSLGITESRTKMTGKSRTSLAQDISRGRAGSSMPGYARENGGPLTPEQIKSLVDYIKKNNKRR